MTFYERAEELYSNHVNKIRKENSRKSMYEGSPDVSIYDSPPDTFTSHFEINL